MAIKTEKLNPASLDLKGRTQVQRGLLVNEIAGAETNYVMVKADSAFAPAVCAEQSRILFFISGRGEAETGGVSFSITEMAVLAVPPGTSCRLKSAGSALTYLEILWRQNEDELAKKPYFSPYFLSYSQAHTYKEACKSPKTVSRTLIPENTIPRFCMGSVQTTGPDLVGAHKHPMLEQHFYGLPGNQCIVKADALEADFGENILLHIPLGSEHSVRVEEGHNLHYLWLDFFRDQKDMSWITQSHVKDENP
jgi:mannose-6-phosphate isomerase-like protein (cupin superfamily)